MVDPGGQIGELRFRRRAHQTAPLIVLDLPCQSTTLFPARFPYRAAENRRSRATEAEEGPETFRLRRPRRARVRFKLILLILFLSCGQPLPGLAQDFVQRTSLRSSGRPNGL